MLKIYQKLKQKLIEIKKLIYKKCLILKNIVIYPIRYIKIIHHRLVDINQETLADVQELNVYGMFQQWLIDVIMFGFICSISYIAFIGYPGYQKLILILFGFGMIPSIIIQLRSVILNGELN